MNRVRRSAMSYKLPSWVVEKYAQTVEPFGFNGLGKFIFKRTYARIKADGVNETWAETVERVINGTYSMQKNHVTARGLGWDDKKADDSAVEMYDRIFNLKFTPPGRGLWAMGTKITEDKGIFAALNNCFSGDTMFEIRHGTNNREKKYVTFKEVVDTEVYVCCFDRKIRKATVKSFGKQKLQKITFKFIRKDNDNSNDVIEDYVVECTANHRWLLTNGEFTTTLSLGDEVPTVSGHRYKVILIEPVDADDTEVFCVTEPETSTFCIQRGVITGNCAFVSTKDIASEKSKPFRFLKDMSMLGVGCGFDVKGARTVEIKPLKVFAPLVLDDPDVEIIYKPNAEKEKIITGYIKLIDSLAKKTEAKRSKMNTNDWNYSAATTDLEMYQHELNWVSSIDRRGIQFYVIEDTREGWVESVGRLIDTYFNGSYPIIFDYSVIRKAGQPLKTFGGLSSGPVPLIDLHIMIRRVLNSNVGKPITERTIVDVMNLIGKCVVAGNVRRCLPEGTLVHTNRGIIKIEDLVPGDKVIVGNTENLITDVIEQGVQDCFEVTTLLGSFYATAEHRMAVANCTDGTKVDFDFKFKKIKDLFPSDKLLFSRHTTGDSVYELPPSDGSITIPKLDEDIAWFFGCISGIKIISSVNNDTIIVPASIPSKGRIVKQFQRFGDNVKVITMKFRGSYVVAVQSTQLAAYIKMHVGVNVPDFINKGKREIRAAYVNGLREIAEENLAISHCKEFINQVQAVYASLGIPSSHMMQLDQSKTLHNFNKFIPIEMVGVSDKAVPMKTYDISVENISCFAIGNGLISHNSSEIALGPLDSTEFIDLKDYTKHPERAAFGWCSNNSIYGQVGMDYTEVAKRIANNGEPGIFWMKNAQEYSRMCDPPDHKDFRIMGTNPCAEQSLESYELCCLCEIYPTRHETIEDFLRTLKFAYLYAKTVTLGDSHWVETNRVMMRNRRIGCSLTGLTQFLAIHSLDVLREWCERGYKEIQKWDRIYSEWLAIPRSVKTTSIKPSGCVIPSTQIIVSDDEDNQYSTTMNMQSLFADCGVDLVKCFSEGVTNKWFTPVMNTWVKNRYGKMEKVNSLYVNGVVECYEVPLADGSTITCTGDHKFLVKREGSDSPSWVRCDELQVGDDIVSTAA